MKNLEVNLTPRSAIRPCQQSGKQLRTSLVEHVGAVDDRARVAVRRQRRQVRDTRFASENAIFVTDDTGIGFRVTDPLQCFLVQFGERVEPCCAPDGE